MRRILLDTSAYSGLMRGTPSIVSAVRSADSIAVNPIVLGELRSGFAGGHRRDANEALLDRFLASPRVRVATIDEETSIYYSAIHARLRARGTPIPANDLWIGATAMQHGFVLLTTDAHFGYLEQILVEWG